MAYSPPNPKPYASSLWTAAQPSGPPLRRYPLPQDCPTQFEGYAFDQQFQMMAGSFPPAPKNTQASAAAFGLSDANAILTSLSPPAHFGAGGVEFTASFNIVPASWDQFTTATVTFPGWIDVPAAGDSRPAFSRNVMIRTRYDYFVLDPAAVLASAGVLDSGGNAIARVASKGAIPILKRGQWLQSPFSTPIPNAEVNDLVLDTGVGIGDLFFPETFPTLDNYKLWCAVAEAFRVALTSGGAAWDQTHPPVWDGTGTAATYGQYVFQDSVIAEQSYAGNIIQRATSYALFQ